MTKVCCKETKVECTCCMTDRDMLTDILAVEKQITTNTAIAITEASNINLKEKIKDIFNTVENLQRKTYELAWNNGWYVLEESTETKLNETYNTLNKRIKEIEDI